MSASSRPPKLLDYLMEHDFLPQNEGAWFDRATADRIIRVVDEHGEETYLIALTPRGACLYKDYFSPGTPHGVIIAAIEAALILGQPSQDGQR
jgi:hypothetical protein